MRSLLHGTSAAGTAKVTVLALRTFGGRAATVTAVVSSQLLKCLSPPCDMDGSSEKTVSVQLRVGSDPPLPTTLPFTYRATKGGGATPSAVDSSEAVALTHLTHLKVSCNSPPLVSDRGSKVGRRGRAGRVWGPVCLAFLAKR